MVCPVAVVRFDCESLLLGSTRLCFDDYEEQSFEVLFIPDDAVECVAVRLIKVLVREGGGGAHHNFERT